MMHFTTAKGGAAGYMITAGYLSFYLYSFITSVCTITAIVINQFHWNLVLRLELPVGQTD